MARAQAAGERRHGVPRGLARTGPVLFSYGFRPFFLGAGLVAAAAMALWIAALTAGLPVGGDYGAVAWHGHEMLFGFGAAVLAGFLMTAIPNWTGRMPLSGRPLAVLFGLWLAGRIVMAAPQATGHLAAAAIDAAFLPVLLVACTREIVAGRKWGNLKVLGGLAAVAGANLWFHAATLGGDPAVAMRLATAAYVLLVTIIGGRVIPSFTRNWLSQRGRAPLPAPFARADGAVIVAGLAALLGWAVAPEARLTLVTAVAAAALNAWRLSRWRGLAVRREPLLLVLHVAFGFVPLGFLAIAAAAAGWLPPAGALHVLTVGVIGGMMLAMMTRATRGHTGRALTASAPTVLSYLCLLAAALARPAADLTGAAGLLELAGGLWVVAFGLFGAEYGPMLLLRRREPIAR